MLRHRLIHVNLPLRTNLETANEDIEHCFFMTQGFASVVANNHDRTSIEVGLVGYGGVTGCAAILRSDQSPNATFMQFAGSAYRISITDLREVMDGSKAVSKTLTTYVHAFMVQNSQTALSNAKARIDERLARWLLMAHDRIGTRKFRITHEFLALMLAVHRPGVTTALHELEAKGAIKSNRTEVTVVDRAALRAIAGWSYGLAEMEYERLFGSRNADGTIVVAPSFDELAGA